MMVADWLKFVGRHREHTLGTLVHHWLRAASMCFVLYLRSAEQKLLNMSQYALIFLVGWLLSYWRKKWLQLIWADWSKNLSGLSATRKNFHIFSPFIRQTFLLPPAWSFQSLSCPFKFSSVSLTLFLSLSITRTPTLMHAQVHAHTRTHTHSNAHALTHVDTRLADTHTRTRRVLSPRCLITLGLKNAQDILGFLLV